MLPLPDHAATKRLVLRTWRAEDAEALGAAIAASLDHLVPWMPWAALEPLPIADRLRLIAEWESGRDSGSDVVYGVFLDGAIVGGCGLHGRRGPSVLEIGYWTHVHFTHRGFASEVSAALTELAFTVDGIERVEIHHDRANAASRGVPRTLGFELVGEHDDEITAPGEEGVDCTWAVTKAQWRERSGAIPR